jgi:predicted aspartyl protease
VALVETLETANSSLLGMGFLNKFKEVKWSLIAKELVFYK